MEYAVHHQQDLKGLVISNMMSSAPLYNAYANDVLMPAMDQDVLAEIKRLESPDQTHDPRYEHLLMEHHYVLHVCRMPRDEWPDPVVRSIGHINPAIYVPMQGPSELGMSGTLESWDRSGDLAAAIAVSPIACRVSGAIPGAGASSMSFWFRRCVEQSRSPM